MRRRLIVIALALAACKDRDKDKETSVTAAMDLREYRDDDGMVEFSYPASWRVSKEPSFQIVNTESPYGAFTITSMTADRSFGGPSDVRLTELDRKRADAGPDNVIDSWVFAAGRVAGMVTYVHATDDSPEEPAARVIMDSFKIHAGERPRPR